ncbi:MAG: hypothetical protein WBA77_01925 [Microcoleaceae cyanobacterium]
MTIIGHNLPDVGACSLPIQDGRNKARSCHQSTKELKALPYLL